jgi:hypothetical protein
MSKKLIEGTFVSNWDDGKVVTPANLILKPGNSSRSLSKWKTWVI